MPHKPLYAGELTFLPVNGIAFAFMPEYERAGAVAAADMLKLFPRVPPLSLQHNIGCKM